MRQAMAAVFLWLFCVLVGSLSRYAIVSIFDVWSDDGRLLIDPWQFTFVSSIPLAVAGGLYLFLVTVTEES